MFTSFSDTCHASASIFPLHRCQPRGRYSARARVGSKICASQHHDVAVVGAGAAGLAAAYFAADASADASILLLEKNAQAGRKILISGGTRCNVLPAHEINLDADFFTESSRSALRSCFSRWSVGECREWLSSPECVGIPLVVEEETEKVFPVNNNAKSVRNALLAACRRKGVKVQRDAEVVGLRQVTVGAGFQRETDDGGKKGWQLQLQNGDTLTASRVVMATGGKSFPSLGTTGQGWNILQHLGIELHMPYPALTPLRGEHPGADGSGQPLLAGVSMYDCHCTAVQHGSGTKHSNSKEKRKKSRKTAARRSAMLFTHRGFSGPAILDLSHHFTMAERPPSSLSANAGSPPALIVNWVRGMSKNDWEATLAQEARGGLTPVTSVLRRKGIPARLSDALCAAAGLPNGRAVAELRKEERKALLDAVVACQLRVTGHEGYGKAEVTGGGMPLDQLDCATMESRSLPGIHVCGELCDVHGRIGGFNFYWAWASGRLAGLGAVQAVVKHKREKVRVS